MPGMKALADALKDLFEALAWLTAFFFIVVMPVSLLHKWLLIGGWFAAALITLYLQVRKKDG